MMKITQMPVAVTLKKEQKTGKTGRTDPYNLDDLPTDIPIQVFGWMEFVHPSGTNEPCWLLLGYTGVHPVAMSLVGNPMSWDEEVTG